MTTDPLQQVLDMASNIIQQQQALISQLISERQVFNQTVLPMFATIMAQQHQQQPPHNSTQYPYFPQIGPQIQDVTAGTTYIPSFTSPFQNPPQPPIDSTTLILQEEQKKQWELAEKFLKERMKGGNNQVNKLSSDDGGG